MTDHPVLPLAEEGVEGPPEEEAGLAGQVVEVGSGEDEVAAGLQDAGDLPEEMPGVLQVLDRLQGDAGVEDGGGKGEGAVEVRDEEAALGRGGGAGLEVAPDDAEAERAEVAGEDAVPRRRVQDEAARKESAELENGAVEAGEGQLLVGGLGPPGRRVFRRRRAPLRRC